MLASTSLLRDLINQASDEDNSMSISSNLKKELEDLCATLDTSGHSLDSLLNDVLDFLDVGGEYAEERDLAKKGPQREAVPMEIVLNEVVQEAWELEKKNRLVTGGDMDGLEVFFELLPRETGTWQLDRDKLPLQR